MSETDADAEPIVAGSSVTEDQAGFNLMFVVIGFLAGAGVSQLVVRLGYSFLEVIPVWLLAVIVVIYGVLSIVGAFTISPDDFKRP